MPFEAEAIVERVLDRQRLPGHERQQELDDAGPPPLDHERQRGGKPRRGGSGRGGRLGARGGLGVGRRPVGGCECGFRLLAAGSLGGQCALQVLDPSDELGRRPVRLADALVGLAQGFRGGRGQLAEVGLVGAGRRLGADGFELASELIDDRGQARLELPRAPLGGLAGRALLARDSLGGGARLALAFEVGGQRAHRLLVRSALRPHVRAGPLERGHRLPHPAIGLAHRVQCAGGDVVAGAGRVPLQRPPDEGRLPPDHVRRRPGRRGLGACSGCGGRQGVLGFGGSAAEVLRLAGQLERAGLGVA